MPKRLDTLDSTRFALRIFQGKLAQLNQELRGLGPLNGQRETGAQRLIDLRKELRLGYQDALRRHIEQLRQRQQQRTAIATQAGSPNYFGKGPGPGWPNC